MRSLCIIALCFLLSSSLLSAQQLVGRPTQESLNSLANIKPGTSGFQTFSTIDRTQGTPYLLEDWQVGQIRFTGSEFFSVDIPLLLDMEQNKIFIKFDDGQVGEFPIWKINSVRIFPDPVVAKESKLKTAEQKDTVNFEVHNLHQQTGNGPNEYVFYQVLYKGNYRLLYWHKKYMRKEKYIENVGIVRRPDEYRVQPSYWLLDDNQVSEIRRNSKALEKILPRKASAIKRFIKSHDLNVKEIDDLVQLFTLLDT